MSKELKKQIKFRLTNKEFEEFKKLVKENGLSMQFLLREFVLGKTKWLKGAENEC